MQSVALQPVTMGANKIKVADSPNFRTSSVLQTTNLSVYYGEQCAVDQVSLSFPKQSVTALIGPSGCGKSTFLRSINRMNDEIDHCRIEGEIFYEGVELHSPRINLHEVRKQIGMVFQRPVPFAKSIFKNVASGPMRHGIKNKAELQRIVEDSLKKAALWEEVKDQLHTSALSLSGGQQQRLCIARALAMQPKVLLLDEPASALDPVSTAKIEELIAQLKKDYTIVIVTHNMQQAARISDTVAYFYMGRVVEHGPTEQIFNNPVHEQTAHYINGRIG